ncbi:MAG: 2-oxoacid:ferredoxin oxidoreductase subunit beta [Thermicanus sp.]|nr:2-oxoacid:ferredoxin oxidoreductase subunit beta [Thermicanus sp.]
MTGFLLPSNRLWKLFRGRRRRSTVADSKTSMQVFRVDARPTWCPGCGDYTVLASLQRAVANLGLQPEEVVLSTGIGCSGKLSQHFGSYGFHGLHGRSLPIAQGVQLANPRLTVIAAGGDGDGYGIGLGHFLHALRRNVNITYIVMDNNIYGLTTGQTSPTSAKGFKSKTSPHGAAENPIRPLYLALSQGASFVAQAFSGDVKEMTEIFEAAIRHKGFSLVNSFSPCVTFNKINTYDWFKEHLVKLSEQPDYHPKSHLEALSYIDRFGGLVTGIIFQQEGRRAYHEENLGGEEIMPFDSPVKIPNEEREKILAYYY